MLDINKIYLGDCLEIMKKINNQSVDMILCDLPYGVTQCKWDTVIPFEKLWAEYERIIKDNGAILLTAIEPFASALRLSNIKMYKYDWVWDKIKGTGFLNAKKQPMRCYENICVFYKKQPTYNPQKTFGHEKKVSHRKKDYLTEVYNPANKETYYSSTERYPRNIIKFSTDTQKSSLHPTQKPVALFRYLIKTYSNENDIILDNCIGSGTTAIAAIAEHRNYIGIEKDKKYFDIANKRIEDFCKKPRFEATSLF